MTETQIDLSPALESGFGQVLAIVEPPNQPKPRNRWEYRSRQWVRVWAQVTKLGLTAYRDNQQVHGYISELSTGAPRAGATLSVFGGRAAKSNARGLALVDLGGSGEHLLASLGKDRVLIPGNSGTFVRRSQPSSLRWFVIDDRKLYKPGEKVRVMGFLRREASGKRGDLGKVGGGMVEYAVFDPRGAELSKGTARLTSSDSFSLDFVVPKNANTGFGSLKLRYARGGFGRSYRHRFQIEEFRRPEFEVTAETSLGPHYVGKHAIATVSAAYFAGGGLPEAKVEWNVRAEDAHFRPPNRSGYHFGKPQRRFWWDHDNKEARLAEEPWKAHTDADGKHHLRIDFDALTPAYPRKLDLEANVTDVNRQSWSARSSFVVHPARVTVGLRSENQLLKAGAHIQLDVVVTDIEGKAVVGRQVGIQSTRIRRHYRGRRSIVKELDTQTCAVKSDAQAVRCSLPTSGGGEHRIVAIVRDASGRASQTQMKLFVLGDDLPRNPRVGQDRADLIPNKEEYRGGETAEILVSSPFAPAEGVLTLRREGVVKITRFTQTRRSQTIKVPIDPAWIPNVHARVDLMGARVREGADGKPDSSLPKRPAYASGEVSLLVPPQERELRIGIQPSKRKLSPGASSSIGLRVTDREGKPVAGAELGLIVVDESVLALTGYELPDPLKVLYPFRRESVAEFESRMRVALMRPDTARVNLKAKEDKRTAKNGEGPLFGLSAGSTKSSPRRRVVVRKQKMEIMANVSKPSPKSMASQTPAAPPPPPGQPKVKVRSDFSALAAFIPRLKTNAQGRVRAAIKLPESVTRYRVMAVAAHGEGRFGHAESDVTARLPLMVRPSAPRFLNFGDRFSLPVVLQNQTSRSMNVNVVARSSNAQLVSSRGLGVTVPANDRVEVRFDAKAGEPGTARFQVGALSGKASDAAEFGLPIWTPATTEAFATYGVIDQGAVAQLVKRPAGVYTQVGQLEVTTASTALQGLTDAVLYLVKYPFDCNEQIASRILAIAALKDVLGAFEAPALPSKAVLIRSIAHDLKRLSRRQHYSGGWDYWRKDRRPDPFVSVHVMHALARAKQKGFKVPSRMAAQGLSYLRNIRSQFPPWYHESSRRTVRAYALSTRYRHGDSVKQSARDLFREVGGVKGISMDGLGWLLTVMAHDDAAMGQRRTIRRHLDNKIAETAGKAHFVTRVSNRAHVVLESNRRTDGILLEAMIDDRPSHDALPKIAQGLLAHRKRGRWLNTQENVFVLLALDRYFQAYEKATPNFVARAWLGNDLAAEHRFRGRSVDRKHVDIPLSLVPMSSRALTIAKAGTGRLYYRVGMQYVPKDLRPPPVEHGFSLSRLYEGVDKKSDVRRDRDGTWRVKLGSRVRVRVAMVAPARRYHVALVDPIPAGFEAQNPRLATTGSIPRDDKLSKSKRPWWWSRVWYEHQNLRDERVEAFASLVYGGTYDFNYVARATTPGTFVVPPPKAEEMYDPETFGRGAGDRVVIQ